MCKVSEQCSNFENAAVSLILDNDVQNIRATYLYDRQGNNLDEVEYSVSTNQDLENLVLAVPPDNGCACNMLLYLFFHKHGYMFWSAREY